VVLTNTGHYVDLLPCFVGMICVCVCVCVCMVQMPSVCERVVITHMVTMLICYRVSVCVFAFVWCLSTVCERVALSKLVIFVDLLS